MIKFNFLKKFLIFFFVFVSLFLQCSCLSVAAQQPTPLGLDAVHSNVNKAAGDSVAGYTTGIKNTGQTTINTMIGSFISLALSFLGVIFLILVIYGGFIWMLARGKEEEAKRAMQIIQMALIGLVIVIAAYSISYVVMSNLSSTLTA